LGETLPSLYCATMRIREWDKDIVFLHEVVGGVADRSYGIHVARMAGLPPSAIARASQVLAELENAKKAVAPGEIVGALPAFDAEASPDVKTISKELEGLLMSLDPDALNPRQALDLLYKIKGAV
ncbi:MAG: DNA mismatch repair protein MutS, partial [Alphaproteobacteria bacterium]|nr:DNA mismatch repair protein MutS [Alphaproteobacteria bacterium]